MSNVAVLVASYKRPAQLEKLLISLADAHNVMPFDVIVVDNDVDQSAQAIVLQAVLDISYYVEPRPGIAAARNRALNALSDHHEWVVFVDDDERVSKDWLERLFETQLRYNADVVSGPVSPTLPSNVPRWINSGRFFERPQAITGSQTRWPATNNCLVRSSTFSGNRRHRFSEEFSITGGSDTEFFWRIETDGAKFVWCNEATVAEDVPEPRLTLKWLWRRGRRLGNVSARMQLLKGRHRAIVTLIGAGRVLLSPAIILTAALSGKPWGPAAMNLPKAVGMLDVAIHGKYVQEYGRS